MNTEARMHECPRLGECAFFLEKMGAMPLSTEMLKEEYCRNNYTICARYVVFLALGKDNIPQDLFPNEPNRAREILARHSPGTAAHVRRETTD